jgi:hypothetical protein
VRLTLNVVMQNDGNFVDVILLYMLPNAGGFSFKRLRSWQHQEPEHCVNVY